FHAYVFAVSFFFSLLPPPPRSTLFPYTTLFRSRGGSTALLFAARVGDLESARLLLAAGANLNDTLPDGTTVLIEAAHSGHGAVRSEEHTSELQSQSNLVCRLLLEKKKKKNKKKP